jgi:hypothetical protein
MHTLTLAVSLALALGVCGAPVHSAPVAQQVLPASTFRNLSRLQFSAFNRYNL